MLWGADVIEDIDQHLKKCQKEVDENREKLSKVHNNYSVIEMLADSERKSKRYAQEIANYKLAVQNDTEVIYKLFVHRDIFEKTIKEFLEKTDEKNKELLLATLNEVKSSKEQDQEYKDKLWKWVNQPNFSGKSLWTVKNMDKINYTPALLFPDLTKK